MHAQDRHACVDRIDVAVRHVFGNRTAAALVDFSHLRQLPDDSCLVEQTTQISDQFRRSVAGRGLSSCPGILADGNPVIQLGFRAFFRNLGIQRIIGCSYVCRKAEAVLKAMLF